jgi:predicted RNase H-like HicB family nuclease
MGKVQHHSQITSGISTVNTNLELYLFKEGQMYIAYCPAIDISAYGKSENEARASFDEALSAHLTYCIDKNTLADDLKAHGWQMAKGKEMKTPTVEQQLICNEQLRSIVFSKEYKKISSSVSIPQFA